MDRRIFSPRGWVLILMLALLAGCAPASDGAASSGGVSASGELPPAAPVISSPPAASSEGAAMDERAENRIALPVPLAGAHDAAEWWRYDETIDQETLIYRVGAPENIFPLSPYTDWPVETPYYIASVQGASEMMNLPAYEGLPYEAYGVHVCVVLSFGKDLNSYTGPGYEAPHLADCMLLRAFADDGSDPDLLFDVTGSGELLLGREALAERLLYDDGAVVVYDILPYVEDHPAYEGYAAGGFEAEVDAYVARIEAGEEPVSSGWETPYDPDFSRAVRDYLVEEISSCIGPLERVVSETQSAE